MKEELFMPNNKIQDKIEKINDTRTFIESIQKILQAILKTTGIPKGLWANLVMLQAWIAFETNPTLPKDLYMSAYYEYL